MTKMKLWRYFEALVSELLGGELLTREYSPSCFWRRLRGSVCRYIDCDSK